MTRGDVNHAANYINENREKRKEARKKALAEQILDNERKKLGKCEDGTQYVDPNFVKMLVNMGFNREIARRALQKNNNVISDSIQYIQDNPVAGPSESKSQEFLSYLEELIPEVTLELVQAIKFVYTFIFSLWRPDLILEWLDWRCSLTRATLWRRQKNWLPTMV